MARAEPRPSSWVLSAIATAQARAGDLEGARATFADAVREAEGGFGGAASARGLSEVGRSLAESGLEEEARSTLRRAFEVLPGPTGDLGKDHIAFWVIGSIVRDQARIGDLGDARKTADVLLVFVNASLQSTGIGNARAVVADEIAAALAAVRDFETAFEWAEGFPSRGNALGRIAEAAAECLDREAASHFVREAAERLARLETADQTYFGLSDLAEAQARLGDVEAAKRSARSIGVGPSRVANDMTDGQIYALSRVAAVQGKAGDTAGARETLQEAFRSVGDHPRMRDRDERYGQVAGGLLAIGDLVGAKKAVEAMTGRRPLVLAHLARAQAAAGEGAAVRETFARALGDVDRLVGDRTTPDAELGELAEIQAMAGDLPGALRALRAIFDENRQRSAVTSVVSARATAGDVAGALRLGLEEFRSSEQRRAALEGLGRGVTTRLDLKSLDPHAE